MTLLLTPLSHTLTIPFYPLQYGRSFASKRKRVRKFSDEEEKKEEEDQGIGLEEEEDQFGK